MNIEIGLKEQEMEETIEMREVMKKTVEDESSAVVPAHAEFAPSSMERKYRCPGSYMLEKLVTGDITSEYAEAGTRMHKYAQNLIEEEFHKMFRNIPADADLQELQTAEKILDFVKSEVESHGWDGDMLATEQRVAYKGGMGRELYYGTCDLIVLDNAADMIHIYDWKTGFRKVDEADDNMQGASYALAAMQTFKKSRCRVVFFNPVIKQLSEGVFDDWNEIYEVINKVIEKCNMPNAPRCPGEKQCMYCKAASAGICPEFLAWKNAVVKVASADEILPIEKWTDENLSIAMRQCRLLETFKKKVEEELKARVEKFGECAGWKIKETAGGREATDINGIFSAVSSYFTPEEFMSFCNVSLPKLSKEYAARAKSSGEVKTAKDGGKLFENIVAQFVSDKAPRRNLVAPSE